MARFINRAHAAFAEHGFDVILAVEYGINQRGRVIFKDFAVRRAEAHTIIVFGFTNRTILHKGFLILSHQNEIGYVRDVEAVILY